MGDPDGGRPVTAARVEDVSPNRPDFAGNAILCVYAYNPPVYAVYRTENRVMAHFADDPEVAATQRAMLSCLTALRGQVNSLVDGWHNAGGDAGSDNPLRKRAARYDRRVADALVIALGNDAATALALLAEIKNDIISERTSRARIAYLSVALALTVGLAMVALTLASPFLSRAVGFPGEVRAVWIAVAGGTLGAFFSIAIGLKGRTVLIDLQNRDNFADASLRMLIGAIAGGMLLGILVSGLISSVIASDQLVLPLAEPGAPARASYLLIFVIGFVAGFFERLVPDLLSQTKLGTEENTSGVTGTPNASGPPIPPSPPPPAPAAASEPGGEAGSASPGPASVG